MFYAGVIFSMKMKMKERHQKRRMKKNGLVWSLAVDWWVKVILFKVDIFSYFLFRFSDFKYIYMPKLNKIESIFVVFYMRHENALSVYDEYWSFLMRNWWNIFYSYAYILWLIAFSTTKFHSMRTLPNKHTYPFVTRSSKKTMYFLLIMRNISSEWYTGRRSEKNVQWYFLRNLIRWNDFLF